MPSITVHGVRLHYEDTGGSGPVVLFVHGLLWSSAMFGPQASALADTYRCVRFDLRGQGRSEVAPSGYDIDTLADDAAALIAALGLAPVHFVGLSMGGFIGLRLAAYRPSLLRSLTLIASAADEEPRENLPKYRAMSAGVRLVGPGPFVRALMPVMFGESFLRDPSRAAERALREAELGSLDRVGATRATEGVLTRRSVVHLLGAIETRTQIVSGTEDRAVIPARARETAARIRGARFVPIERAGHTATLENPDAVTAALRSFFEAN